MPVQVAHSFPGLSCHRDSLLDRRAKDQIARRIHGGLRPEDSAIAARILKISNSALYGYGGIAADPEVAFTAGLMHHIGKTAMANSHRSEYERVMMTVDNEGRSFIEVAQI